METLRRIVKGKPFLFILVPFAYLVLCAFAKWTLHPVWGTLFFLLGGLLGMYFLDAAEIFFNLSPSPFRSILFFAGLVVVTLFIITSSGSMFASGLVLSLYLTLLLWFGKEFARGGDTGRWFRQFADPVTKTTSYWVLGALFLVFVLVSVLFVR
jgi:hypothetical protein